MENEEIFDRTIYPKTSILNKGYKFIQDIIYRKYDLYIKESEISNHPLSIILDDGINEYRIDNDKDLNKALNDMIQEV